MSITVLTTALWLSAIGADADVSAWATLEPPEIPYHHTASYVIVAEGPDAEELSITPPEMKAPGLEFSAGDTQIETLPNGRKRVRLKYTIDPIEVREHSIPPAAVQWGDGQELSLPTLRLRVRELSDAEREAAERFEDIEAPPVPASLAYPWIALGIAAVVLLAALGLFLLRRPPGELSVPPPKPWEVALQRLRELEQKRLPGFGKFDEYYVDLSAILRYYIEDRFHLRAPEQTTPEFLETARSGSDLTEPQQQTLADFLVHCDRVKFARYEPGPEEMEGHFDVVRSFVRETVPNETEEAAA